MERFDDNWVEELRNNRHQNINFLALHADLAASEKAFKKVLKTLEPETQRIIMDFVRMNMKVETWLTEQAYINGMKAAERRTKRWNDHLNGK